MQRLTSLPVPPAPTVATSKKPRKAKPARSAGARAKAPAKAAKPPAKDRAQARAAEPPRPEARPAAGPTEASPTAQQLDIQAFSKNIARMVEQGGKAMAAYMKPREQGRIEGEHAEVVDVVKTLKDNKVDVMVSYLPVGSEEADKFYAQCAIDAGVAFVNALPVFIASDPVWAKKFEDAGVPIVGDDIKSQVGATITHRVMAKLFEDRGVQLDRTMQLNVGGNMDFLNMLERSRLESKKISKTQAVTSNLQREFNTKDVHIGPSDHVGWLDDRKWAYVRLEGRAFGDVPLNLEYKLEVWDSPNSAGVIIDAVRAAKIAKDRGIGGPVEAASAYLMKSPPQQMPDDIARAQLEDFIEG